MTAQQFARRLRRRYRRLRNRPWYWRWRRFVVTQSMRTFRLPARPIDDEAGLTAPKLFIIGAARSGTTWVNEMLERHPDVITEAESHAYGDVFQPVVEAGGSEAGWTEVLVRDDRHRRQDTRLRVKLYVGRRRLRRLVRHAMAQECPADEAAEWVIAQVFGDFYRRHGGDGHQVFVEKTPNHTLYGGRILDRFADARLIEVVRDGRDVAVSKHMKRVSQGRSAQTWTPAERNDRAEHWANYVRIGADLRNDPRYADRILLVRYEDLRRDPCAGVERLLDFAGLAHDPALVERIVGETDFSRFATGEGKHRRQGKVGGWREYFSDDDRQRFAEVAGHELALHGYEA